MTSFSEEMRRRGMRPGSKTLSLETTHAGAYLGRCLHVSPSERIVVAKRLRLADDETMAIETLHVPESLVPGLTPRGPRRDVVLRPAHRPLRDRDRRRRPDDRADGDERGGVGGRSASRSTRPRSSSSARRRSESGDDRRVRALDLPRRPVPARDRAEPARPRRARRPVLVPRERRRDRGAPPVGGDTRRAAPERDPRAARRAPAAARARRRVRARRRRAPANGARRSSGWSATAPPTTRRRTASTRSACCPAGRRCATRSRSPSTTARELDLRGSSRARALAVGPDAGRRSTTSSARGRAARSRSRSRTSVDSELADGRRRRCLPLAAGPEHAVAATKTYTTQIAALALLAAHAAGPGRRVADGIRRTGRPARRAAPGRSSGASRELAVALAFVGRMFVIGRGPEFATAREISLKLLETCRVAAEPLTATDLAHGPVAASTASSPSGRSRRRRGSAGGARGRRPRAAPPARR